MSDEDADRSAGCTALQLGLRKKLSVMNCYL
jgi:hypothetical protein